MMDDFRPGNGAQNDQPNNETNPNPVQGYNQSSEPNDSSETTSNEIMATPNESVSTEQTAAPVTVIATKKRGKAGKWLLGGLAVVLLAAACALAYWQWTEAENARTEAAMLRSSLETANSADKDTDKAVTDPKVSTTMALAEAYAEAYAQAGKEIKFSTKVEKTDGDAALIYTKAELPNAEPTYFVVKRVDENVVAVDSYSPSMSPLQAALLKEIYGIDVARLGVKVEEQ